MAPEYIIGAAVAAIVLILLFSALTGRKTKRVVMTKNSGTDDQTAQLKRIADAVETIASRLQSLSPQIQTRLEELTRPVEPAPPRLQKSREEPPRQSIPVEPVRAEEHTPPGESPSATATPDAAGQTQSDEPAKPHRIKLSMFGR
jgi:hypothetical protein